MRIETVWVVNEIREYEGNRFVTLYPAPAEDQPFIQDHYAEIWGENSPTGVLELRYAVGSESRALHPGHCLRITIEKEAL